MRDGRSQRRTRIAVAAGIALVGAAVVAVAAAQPSGDGGPPVLHERVEGLADFRWDPVEPEGAASLVFPGPNPPRPGEEALDPDGPDPARPPTARTAEPPLPPRPGSPVSDVPPEEFHPDLDTDSADLPRDANPPGIIWSPSPGPYLRQQVFDVVLADGSLDAPAARREELHPVESPDGTPGAERFLGRARLWIADESVVQIPTPAPDYRAAILSGASDGDRLAVDRAGNLYFVPGPARGEREMLIALEADPETFGGTLDPAPAIGSVPAGTRRDVPDTLRGPARRVAERIAVSPDMPVEAVLRLLSTWFRSFQPGPPPSDIPGTAYEELALGRVGLCRHRAYAFVVTAQWLGLPARMPILRLHAWVEVLAPVPGPGGPRCLAGRDGVAPTRDDGTWPTSRRTCRHGRPLPWPRGAADGGDGHPDDPGAGNSARWPSGQAVARRPPRVRRHAVVPAIRGPAECRPRFDGPTPPPEPDGPWLTRESFLTVRFVLASPAGDPIASSTATPRRAARRFGQVTGRCRGVAAARQFVRPGDAGRRRARPRFPGGHARSAFARTLTVPPDAAPGDYLLRAYPESR